MKYNKTTGCLIPKLVFEFSNEMQTLKTDPQETYTVLEISPVISRCFDDFPTNETALLKVSQPNSVTQ